MAPFDELVQEFLEATWRNDPVEATRSGIHRYDHLLPDRSAEAMDGWGQTLAGLERRFEQMDPARLSRGQELDRQWALSVLDYALVNHELELWRRMPQELVDDLGSGLHSLLISEFVPLQERFESLLARLKAIPAYLHTARDTLLPESIPPVWLEQSLLNAQSTKRFIAADVPKAVAMAATAEAACPPQKRYSAVRRHTAEAVLRKDSSGALRDSVTKACLEAAQALDDFEAFLRSQGAGRAQGEYAIGRERFDRILKRFHMLDMDSQDLYEFGREWIDRYEKQMVDVARQIDPDRPWIELLETIKDDHPTPEKLRDAYEEETLLARRHCLEHDLITFPEGESCVLEWTPVFMRARTPIAQPWVSPPFEQGLASKWYITPIDAEAPLERQRQHIRDNSWPWIRGIAMHEIYPGHHLQLVIAKQVATPLRKQFWSPVFGEGWGLYTEELFYETGLLAEPRLRLMQLRNALWRAVRIVVDTGLHTRGMSLGESARWLSERARLEPRWAESETRYYTTRPTYPSSYQVGFARLLELRERYKAKKGSDYRLKSFHDELMSYSSLPLKLVEGEMLGENG